MREFRMHILTRILYLCTFIALVCVISGPFFCVLFLFDKIHNWWLIFLVLIISVIIALSISEIYTNRHPIKIRTGDKRIIIYSLFRKFELTKEEILKISLLKPLWGSEWGKEYCMEASIRGKRGYFLFNAQVIKDIDEFIKLVPLDV